MDTTIYAKGFITYSGGGKLADKLLTRLEDETGIKFKRVSKKSSPDIAISKVDKYSWGRVMGGAYVWRIESRPNEVFIYVNPEATKAWRKMALRHEIGHALGIRFHSDNPKDAMSPASINKSKWYSKKELKFFKKRWLKSSSLK